MSYTPTPVQSQTIPKPIDGDNRDAASVRTAMRKLADAHARMNLEARHWEPAVSLAQKIKRGAFSMAEQAWYAIGAASVDVAEMSQDNGRSWIDLTTSVGLVNSEILEDIACNPNGDIVILCSNASQGVYESAVPPTYGGITFAHHAAALSAQCNGGMVDWSEPHGLWLAVFRSGASGMRANTSSDRATFTNRTMPAGWATYTASNDPVVTTNERGRSVAAFFDDSAGVNKIRVAHSSDGGVTWTATTTGGGAFAGAFNPETLGRPVFDPTYDSWFIVGAKTTGMDSTQIFRSHDSGATWTSVFTNTSGLAFQDIAAWNGVLVAVNVDGRIYVSNDLGATWGLVHRNPITTPARPFLRIANGQALVWNSEDKTSFASMRLGAEGGA